LIHWSAARAWEETTMDKPQTLQDLFDAVLLESFLAVACAAVADQGVEMHQWLRDEQARRGEDA
jgi:hypothetical protein